MSQGDLTDHVSGNNLIVTGDGSISWDGVNKIYKLKTPGSTYKTVLKFEKHWGNMFASGMTVLYKVIRYNESSIARNNCRPVLFGDGTITSEKNPSAMLSVGGLTSYSTLYNSLISLARTTSVDYSNSKYLINYYANKTFWKSENPVYFYEETIGHLYNLNEAPCSDWLSIGCSGHANYRGANFGIKDIRIYNRILTEEEIYELM